MKRSHAVFVIGSALLCVLTLTAGQKSKITNSPAAKVKDTNTPRTFPDIKTKAEWEKRAREIREQVLVSCGLWPLPKKTPLHARIFGKIERDGYSVEKVYFQTYPGFYLGGNLYRPLGQGRGPFPGILNPHGHWTEGRMADTKDGSIAARCINFARQGMVAFSYDMIGYNDSVFAGGNTNLSTRALHRKFGTNYTDQLWNISAMGLQTWNSIRALDFLASLPNVDKKRLACTGESGGGTQTYMLGAVDDRLAAQAPVVMVSHLMQGGCVCENAPGLRVKYSNMELAAVPAPRPQILVACTGDWTRMTLEVEGPAIEGIYRLFGEADRLRSVRFDFKHNYNRTSREAVYDWFGQWLLHHPNPSSLKEEPYQKEPDADLRVFTDGRPPRGTLTQEQFAESLKKLHQAQWNWLVRRGAADHGQFKSVVLPAWRSTLQLDWPPGDTLVEAKETNRQLGFSSGEFTFRRPGEEQGISILSLTPPIWLPNDKKPRNLVLFADAGDADSAFSKADRLVGWRQKLVERGDAVLAISSFSTSETRNQFTNFFTTYNRTKLQERVRDLVTVCARAECVWPDRRVVLMGKGRAGLWALQAAPGADAVIADCDQLDVSDDKALLAPDLFCPGIRNIGTFEGAAMLHAPLPLLLHNTGDKFPTAAIRSAYRALGASKKLRIVSKRLSDDELADWISQLK